MVRRFALRVRVADDVGARVAADAVVAVLVGRAVVVGDAFRWHTRLDAHPIRSFDESLRRVANASAVGGHH